MAVKIPGGSFIQKYDKLTNGGLLPDCIKAELTADMTAISFENYSHHYTL
jgi:hypothetical protein